MRRLILFILHFFGQCLGWLVRVTKSEPARVSRINIGLVFPELSAGEADELFRRNMSELGKLTMEMLVTWCIPGYFLKNQIRRIHGESHLQRALAQKRGVIVANPHLGNWEVFNFMLGQYRPCALYRPVKNKFWDKVINRSREWPGTKTVPFTVTGVRALYRVLEAGGIVMVFPDQLPDGPGRVVVDFLNNPAGTGTLVPRMIQKAHPAVICCYARRLSGARGFDIHIMPALEEVYSDDLTVSAAALNKTMELLIRLSPEQYIWSYKRFKYTVDPGLYARNKPV